MSSNASCNLLKDVKPYKTGWRVRVKMLHSWKQNFGGETLECILADETGGKIHASFKRSQMFRVQRALPIGEWRFVENFTVSQAGGQYRPTNLQYKMTISGDTAISKCDFQNNNHFLDLASYEDIIEGKMNPFFLIDILGEIFDMRGIQTVQVKNEDRKRVVFRLRDTNGNDVECCLWGKFAEIIESHIEDNEGEPIICLIRFSKISYYKGVEKVYISADSIDPSDINSVNDEALGPDFLNTIKVSGLPNHSLRLKVGCPVMVLRNINPTLGLMNGTRLQIIQVMDFMVQARIITGEKVGETVDIPRLSITPSDTRLPFKMRRRQLPLAVAFAITINKSEGQSLSEVGLFLPKPVFSHGQLYVAISRVTSKKGLKILALGKDGKPQKKTMNVVFKEIFDNLESEV
ncbi:uncharacterized protein LOC108846324 [Raphanus sativus]|uniref:Uncharacterized protein LOC108846324 n=1 Tax=Raphanus sativus TaxID=3726 RepID=A0A6J0MRI1_RAPSA|nr:uncharacterized protein LOC108846324 [Raphanus sativus]